VHPAARLRDGCSQRAWSSVELDRGGGHEAAAGERSALVVREPAIDERE
jgi:hypothetical protein